LFATIENTTQRSGFSSDQEEDLDEDDLHHYYYTWNSNSYSKDIQSAQRAAVVEELNIASSTRPTSTKTSSTLSTTATPRREMKPFFAEKQTSALSTMPDDTVNLIMNGPARSTKNGSWNGYAVHTHNPLPPVFVSETNSTTDSHNTTTTTITTRSKRQRWLSSARNVWDRLSSPLRLVRRFRDDVRLYRSMSGTALKSLTTEDLLSPNNNNNNSNNNTESQKMDKKRSKEEALVARMSRKKKKQLSNLLKNVNQRNTKSMAGITARTLTGLLSALAEESEDVSVQMHALEDTPIWRKEIDHLSIEFTRLGFKPLYMGGPDQQLPEDKNETATKKKKKAQTQTSKENNHKARNKLANRSEVKSSWKKQEVTMLKPRIKPGQISAASVPANSNSNNKNYEDDADDCPVEFVRGRMAAVSCADSAFEAIDVDNSGALDKDEIADALVLAATSASSLAMSSSDESPNKLKPMTGKEDRKVIEKLAKQLVDLYDTNDDGVIDREEYQSMVEDMAALRRVQLEQEQKEAEKQEQDASDGDSWWSSAVNTVMKVGGMNANSNKNDENLDETLVEQLQKRDTIDSTNAAVADDLLSMTESAMDKSQASKGKIELEDLKIDLRRLIFGAIPIVKHITPGGPLFLEPFKATVTCSFSAEDIMQSTLLDRGLRQLVSFALRVRVRGVRDLMDGAVFYGRNWKRDSVKAPLVECTEIISVEIDDKDRAIITGRAKVRAAEDAPVIDQSFKLRTRVATPRNGRAIKLSQPEIAIVLECPLKVEQAINATFAKLGFKPPRKPDPIYEYMPIHSPFNKDDTIGGYYMGEDNQIKSLEIKDKHLRIQMETILRPGKFLGSHYLAFTVPQRAIIITVDRVKEGIRAARQRKRLLKAEKLARAAETDRMARDAQDALNLNGLENKSLPGIVAVSQRASGAENEGYDEDDEEEEQNEDDEGKIGGKDSGKGFVSRFVDGYLQAGSAAEKKAKLAHSISDWFGRQSSTDFTSVDSDATLENNKRRPEDAVVNIVEDIAFGTLPEDGLQ